MPSDPEPTQPPPGAAPPAPPGAPEPGAPSPPGPGTGGALPPPGVPHDVRPFATPRRLHPASVVLGVNLTQVLQAFLFPVAATLAAGRAVTIFVLAMVGGIGLVFRILAWQRMQFSFDGEVLRVDSGVLQRSHRSLDVARIQQVEIERNVVPRLLGLAALRVETAGSASEPEVDLRVLPEADAVALRAAVRVSKARIGATTDRTDEARPEGSREPILRVPHRHVVIAAVTGARLLVFPAVIGGALQFVGQQFGQMIERAIEQLAARGLVTVEETVGVPTWTTVTIVAAGALVLSIVTAIVVGLLRDGNFRIFREDDDLHVRRGLLSTRDSVVPLRRIQLVEVQRNWLRRLLGLATVRIRSAGGSAGGEGRVTVPLLPASDVDRLLSALLPNLPGVPVLSRHPKAALRRALFRWLRPALLLALLVWVAPAVLPLPTLPLETPARWATATLVPLSAVLAVVEYRQLAHGLTELVVASRRGALSITTSVAPVVKVQAITSRRSFFQRRLGLTTVEAHVAGPGARLEVLDAASDQAAYLHARLTEHAASPTAIVDVAAAG